MKSIDKLKWVRVDIWFSINMKNRELEKSPKFSVKPDISVKAFDAEDLRKKASNQTQTFTKSER